MACSSPPSCAVVAALDCKGPCSGDLTLRSQGPNVYFGVCDVGCRTVEPQMEHGRDVSELDLQSVNRGPELTSKDEKL